MLETSRSPAPPVWVFAVTATLVTLVLFLAYLSMPTRNDETSPDYFNSARLLELTDTPEDVLKVIAVGTSFTHRAFLYDDEMELLGRQNGLNIEFIRFNKSAGLLHNDYLTLFEQISAAKPDILLIEAALLGRDYVKKSPVQLFITSHSSYVKTHIKVLIRLLLPDLIDKPPVLFPENSNANHNTIEQDKINKGKTGEFERFKKRASQFSVRDQLYGALFENIFDRFASQGTRVILIEMPRPEEVWNILPTGYREEYYDLMNGYEEKYQIPFLQFPNKLSLDHFRDYVHLNHEGRQVYSKWFVDWLSQIG